MTDTRRRIVHLLTWLESWDDVVYALQYRLSENITTVAEALAFARERREELRQEIERLQQKGGDAQ